MSASALPSSPPPAGPEERGVIYLVAGPKSYLGELSTSLKGLRRHHPDLPVTVFSPYPLPRGLAADHVEYVSDLHPLQQKVDVLRRSPYRETLFLDTDTTILRPFVDIFDLGATGNFALAKAYRLVSTDTGEQRLELEHPDQFNTGVLCFDSSEVTRAFLDRWFETVCEQDPSDMWPGHNCDQTWFNRLVADGVPQACGISMVTLPNRVYNARGAMAAELKRRGLWDEVRIFHHRTRAMKARKAVYSLTDRAYVADAGRRVVAKVKRRLPGGG
ncbi:MAG TPA: putative nucleotide-diphospho-sugar transferase [Ilumatobacteraceae bacterium]|nr:putative nucleotide-diphospho-sugar transferase [Ilumatobacteraceae bacterium]